MGDLGPEVTDVMLEQAFNKYASLSNARVVRDNRSKKGKGYGFVSFRLGDDFLAALREMNNKYIGSRPVKLKKSDWKERSVDPSADGVGKRPLPNGDKNKKS